MKKLRVLVVGCGHMGSSHARAYKKIDGFEIAGLVSPAPDCKKLAQELKVSATFADYETALNAVKPDAVSINTYPDTHAAYAVRALNRGAHVFVEKPIGCTVADAEEVVAAARHNTRKLVVGYILRQHPSWNKFIELARELGKPLVMRMNLNQQSRGNEWNTHKSLMKALPPIVDCGVHYVDVMCRMTRSKPVRVSAAGARLSDEISPDMYNYGQLQVTFADGSVGWYEAGWGPMMSENAYFIKDVIGPEGSVSMIPATETASDNVDAHTRTDRLLVHPGTLDRNNQFAEPDRFIDMADEPGHQELCNREQRFFLEAIIRDLDLSEHWEDAINSMKIVLAADKAFRTGKTIKL
ncbi:MAG: Gfo/Idh/MocA family oxidoreductase [Victivallales bacterium]|nr:Gfo/Idh/MocA family oxidoreductase [Victivallales bacterium]